MKVLITGAGGQLGTDVRLRFADHDLINADIIDGFVNLDVTDRDAVMGLVEAEKPDAIVHTAAFTAVDLCETEVEMAYKLNAVAVRHMNEAAVRFGSYLVHISTDYVFSGNKVGPYVEWDTPDPLSVYGASKRAGEMEVDPQNAIVRTSWVCGEFGNNMVKTILRLSGEHDQLSFVDDQVGHPTFTADLADQIHGLVADRRPGLFHVTNQGAVSWHQFAQAVLEASGQDPDRVGPISTADYKKMPATRPLNSVLDNAALRMSGVAPTRDFREPLAEVVARLTA